MATGDGRMEQLHHSTAERKRKHLSTAGRGKIKYMRPARQQQSADGP